MSHLAMLFAIVCGDPTVDSPAFPVVEQAVECISVAHLTENVELIFFWDRVQGEWTCLDHRWASTAMTLSRQGDAWQLAWSDDAESCYRVVTTKLWVESWEPENPLAEQNRRPWFRQIANPGLKKPPPRVEDDCQ